MEHGSFTLTHLVELIRARRFDWVSPEITDKRFPTPNRRWNDYKEFHFGKNISSEEIVRQMHAEGYEPANSHELLSWDEWNEKGAIAALGSPTEINGHYYIPYFDKHGSKRYFLLDLWNLDWDAHFHFLAVRGPSGA